MTVEESWWVQQKPEWWEAGDRTGTLVRIRGRCYKVGVKVLTIDREEADCEPCG